MATGSGLRACLILAFLCLLCVAGEGCKKSTDTSEFTMVAIPGGELNPDGTFSGPALEKIDAKAGAPKLEVAIFRGNLSDAGLLQLAKYPNLRKVDAAGSQVTQAGIDKLKATLPEVEVIW